MSKLLIFMLLIPLPLLNTLELNKSDIDNRIRTQNRVVKSLNKDVSAKKKLMFMEASDLMDTEVGYGLMDLTFVNSEWMRDMLTHKFSVMQEVPVSARLYFRKKAMEYSYLAAGEELNEAQLMIKNRVLRYAVENEKIKWSYENILKTNDLLKKLSEIARSQYTNGKLSLAELIEIEVKYAETGKMLAELETMKQVVQLEIRNELDMDEGDDEIAFPFLADIIDYKKSEPSKVNANAIIEAAGSFNPGYRMQNYDFRMAKSDYQASIQAMIPDLGLGVEYQITPSPEPVHRLGFDVQIKLPLLSLPSRTALILAKKEESEKQSVLLAEYNVNLKRSIEKMTAEAAGIYRQLVILDERIIRTSDTALNTLFTAYQVDKAEIGMTLNSAVMLLEQKNRFYDLLSKYYAILFEIEAMSGLKYYHF